MMVREWMTVLKGADGRDYLSREHVRARADAVLVCRRACLCEWVLMWVLDSQALVRH